MRKTLIAKACLTGMCLLFLSTMLQSQTSIIIDHRHTDLTAIPQIWIDQAKTGLRIAYQHTSHGSQLPTGLRALSDGLGAPYTYTSSSWGYNASVFLNDSGISGASDLGNPNFTAWSTATRTLLNRNGGCNRNVIIWSWCGQADTTSANIDLYLSQMNALEADFPNVKFVYMTGHLNGTGITGNLHLRNQQIRAFCLANGKTLFDFADIESYDPSGNEFLSKNANDGCGYSGGNWAQQWLAANPGHILAQLSGTCSLCAHSERLNCVLKGRAFWWLLARLAGWPGTSSGPNLVVSPSRLNFGAIGAGIKTVSQKVRVTTPGTVNWTASSNSGWLSRSPVSGVGNGVLEISVDSSALSPGRYEGRISFVSPQAANSPFYLPVFLTVLESASATGPYGSLDTPVDGSSGVTGAIPVTGWALDDVEVVRVDVWRDPAAGETPGTNGYVYVGDAVFVEGARPDIETAYPDWPLRQRAGWGYMLLTNFLPGGGNGPFRLHAQALDKDGRTAWLGTKSIVCANAQAVKPFGTIDTPSQGGTVLGPAYINFAWALTPQPYRIPTDGSTMTVWVDGSPLTGRPSYGHFRDDIATLFPGYANSSGPVGFYSLDTTSLNDGIHTIAWSVRDEVGREEGIGSRYFVVENATSGGAIFAPCLSGLGQDIAGFPAIKAEYFSPLRIRMGFDRHSSPQVLFPAFDGCIRIELEELERVEIDLREFSGPGSSIESVFSGHLLVGTEPRPLPVGSRLEASSGRFQWQPGPGFLGRYDFVFFSRSSGIVTERRIQIKIGPRKLGSTGPEQALRSPQKTSFQTKR